jgi:hypothetical protein
MGGEDRVRPWYQLLSQPCEKFSSQPCRERRPPTRSVVETNDASKKTCGEGIDIHQRRRSATSYLNRPLRALPNLTRMVAGIGRITLSSETRRVNVLAFVEPCNHLIPIRAQKPPIANRRGILGLVGDGVVGRSTRGSGQSVVGKGLPREGLVSPHRRF